MEMSESPFHLSADANRLYAEDFRRFTVKFCELVKQLVPTGEKVFFRCVTDTDRQWVAGDAPPPEIVEICDTLQARRAVARGADWLAFHWPQEEQQAVQVIVTGVDHYIVRKAADDWILDVRDSFFRSAVLMKTARIDSTTGFLNLKNLEEFLGSLDSESSRVQLTLIELPPPPGPLRKRIRYRQFCADALKRFFGEQAFRLHYLGYGVFCFPYRPAQNGNGPGRSLTGYLRAEGCYRVHVGSSRICEPGGSGIDPAELLEDGWRALEIAARRGVYSFYDRSRELGPGQHPFHPLSHSQKVRLARSWRQLDRFCLVLVRQDPQRQYFSQDMLKELFGPVAAEDGEDIYLVIDDDGAGSRQWVESRLAALRARRADGAVLAAVVEYPLSGFTRSELPVCAKKALAHAAFYGDIACAVFGGLTLNISGDVYYNDGDMVAAVREYRRGLKLDPCQVNILNSLGVCMAMMNRKAEAEKCFRKVLELEPANFSALYNLGLLGEERKKVDLAYTYFRQALDCFEPDQGDETTRVDLFFRLGKLACKNGEYGEALAYLQGFRDLAGQGDSPGKSSYYYGWAAMQLGRYRVAMTELQRALRFNEFDDRAMHLLGKIYHEQGEGDDIARSLLERCVELSPGDRRYRLTVGALELKAGEYEAARKVLAPCLRSPKYANQVRLMLAEYFVKEGDFAVARQWLRRMGEVEKLPPALQETAVKLRRQIG